MDFLRRFTLSEIGNQTYKYRKSTYGPASGNL